MKRARPPYWISAKGRSCRVFVDNDRGVSDDYKEIIAEDCYNLFNYAKTANPSVIADIGANVGMFAKLATVLFPEADIYAYEPNPEALKWLKKNAESTRIQVFPYAVCLEAGEVIMETRFESTCGGKVSPGGNLRVEAVASSQAAEGRPIGLLKMDCEGSEWTILRDESLLRRTKDLVLEYHAWEGHTVEELRSLVEKGGHRILRLEARREYHPNFGFLWSTKI